LRHSARSRWLFSHSEESLGVDTQQPNLAAEGISMNQPSHESEDWSLRVYPVADSVAGRRTLERWYRDRLEAALFRLTDRIGASCSLQNAPRIVADDGQMENLSDWTTFRWTASDDTCLGFLSMETKWLWRCLVGFLGERAELRIPEGSLNSFELLLAESAIRPLESILDMRLVAGNGISSFAAVPAAATLPADRQGPFAHWTMWQATCRVGGVTGIFRSAIHNRIVEEVLVGADEQIVRHDSDEETSLRLDALLVHSQVSGQGWGDLQKGDIVDCQRSMEKPVLLCIEGKPAFWAKIGSANGRRAVQILSAVES
jgi:hypothetical protein